MISWTPPGEKQNLNPCHEHHTFDAGIAKDFERQFEQYRTQANATKESLVKVTRGTERLNKKIAGLTEDANTLETTYKSKLGDEITARMKAESYAKSVKKCFVSLKNDFDAAIEQSKQDNLRKYESAAEKFTQEIARVKIEEEKLRQNIEHRHAAELDEARRYYQSFNDRNVLQYKEQIGKLSCLCHAILSHQLLTIACFGKQPTYSID